MAERAVLNNGPKQPKQPRERVVPPQPRSTATIAELEAALHIDTFDLTNATADQPELFYRVAKRMGALVAERDTAKLAIEEAESEAQASIRDNVPSGQKITVGEVEALVRLDPQVKAANQRLLAISRTLSEVQALKEAYSQRKSSLTDLVELQRQAGQQIDPAQIKREVAEQRRGYVYQHGRQSHGK